MSWVIWAAMSADAPDSWEIDASFEGGALEVLFGVIGVKTDLSTSSQAREVMLVASCVLQLSTFASQRLSTFRALCVDVLLRVRALSGVSGSLSVGPCTDVTLEVVSMAFGTRNVSDCNIHGTIYPVFVVKYDLYEVP